MTTATLVIGATGQLGSALVRQLSSRSDVELIGQPVRWSDAELSVQDLADGVRTLLSTAGATAYSVLWAAGAAVTSATRAELSVETEVFRRFTELFGAAVLESGQAARTSMFLASSAGGVYAGSVRPPFSEQTIPAPVSPYGDTKLAMELTATAMASASGTRVVIGRISNLYGPGQRIEKPQGFVSQLCKSMLRRQPISVYVSLDTMRDYIYADDAAAVIVACLERLAIVAAPGETVVKNIASQIPTTLGHILHEARLVFKRRPDVILAASSLATGQVRDLRIDSVVWPDLNDLPRRPLIVGLAETLASMQLQVHSKGFGIR